MVNPDEFEQRLTLRTAVARYEQLRSRESMSGAPGRDGPDASDGQRLSRDEMLELLALMEVIIRKAGYGRQCSIRSARDVGASWSEIGRALGTSKQSAWEAHTRWIDQQVDQHRAGGVEGFDDDDARRARELAGSPDADVVV